MRTGFAAAGGEGGPAGGGGGGGYNYEGATCLQNILSLPKSSRHEEIHSN